MVAAAIFTASETTKESKEGKEAQQQPPTYVGGGGNTNSADLNAQFYIDSIFRDVITYLKPRFRVADSYETACRQLETHLKGVAERAKELMPNSSPLSAEQVLKPSTIVPQPLQPLTGKGSRRGSAGGLEPIVEEADCEDDVTLNGDNDSQDGYDEEQRCFNSDGEYAEEEEEEDEEEEEEVVDEEEEDKTSSNKANNSKAPAIVGCTEDDEFQRDFERMLTESLTSRSQEVVRPNVEIVIPIERGGGEKKKTVNSFADEEPDRTQQPFSMALNDRQSTSGDSGTNNRTTFQFRVMARNANKSNKPLFRSIEVSPESELVQNFLAREEELRAQKEAVKRVILDINQRRELQEDSAGGGSSSGSPSRSSTDGSSSGGGGGLGYSSRGGHGHYSHHQQHYQQQHYHHGGGGHYQGGHYSGGGGGYYRQGGGGSGYYHNSHNANNNSGNNSSTNSSGNNSGNNNNSSGQNNTINYQQYRRRFN